MTGSKIRILDEHGRDVPPGEVGEIYFLATHGKGSTYHYLGAEPRTRGDWEYLRRPRPPRRRRLPLPRGPAHGPVLSGGANVYPAEVEAAIDAHPSVLASVVIGLPDADLGQRVHAIVEVREGAARWNSQTCASSSPPARRYKLPRSIETTRERLRDDSGKVRRGACAMRGSTRLLRRRRSCAGD